MRPIIIDAVAWSVGLSVTIMSPAVLHESTELIEMWFGTRTLGRLKASCIRLAVQRTRSPIRSSSFEGKRKGKEEYLYSAFLAKVVHSKRSGMDHSFTCK